MVNLARFSSLLAIARVRVSAQGLRLVYRHRVPSTLRTWLTVQFCLNPPYRQGYNAPHAVFDGLERQDLQNIFDVPRVRILGGRQEFRQWLPLLGRLGLRVRAMLRC